MTSRGLPPLFGAPWERTEVYSLSEIGRSEIEFDKVMKKQGPFR